MNKSNSQLPRNPDLRNSLAALERAAERARELAIQTGTPLFICHNGKIIDALAKKDN
jgi:hypothetical protein